MKMISRDEVLRLLDEDGIVFRKTIERLPTYEIPDWYQHQNKKPLLTKDDVIKGLECCIAPAHCDGCPYDGDDVECINEMMRDAIALLKAEPRKVDCNTANRDAAGCLGYCYSDNDDEPIDVCKRCEQYTGNAEEADHDDG